MMKQPKEAGRPFLVGVCGGSGAGKTSMARLLQERFPDDATILSHDNYYLDLGPLTPEQKSKINFDHPDALDNHLFAEDLGRLLSGKPVSVPIYDYCTAKRTGTKPLRARKLVVVEGLFLFCDPSLSDKFDLKVFVEADESSRVRRIRHRDIILRGQPEHLVNLKIDQYVLPMHERFISPFQNIADLIVNNSMDDLKAIRCSVDQIAKAVKARSQVLIQKSLLKPVAQTVSSNRISVSVDLIPEASLN